MPEHDGLTDLDLRMGICEGMIKMDGFDEAIVGTATMIGHSSPSVCYDYQKMVNVLVSRDGMTEEEAEEYIGFNCLGAYIGEEAPIVLFPGLDLPNSDPKQ
jgi:hypothetical protein